MAEIHITQKQLLAKARDAIVNDRGRMEYESAVARFRETTLNYGITEHQLNREIEYFCLHVHDKLAKIIPEFDEVSPNQIFNITIDKKRTQKISYAAARKLGYDTSDYKPGNIIELILEVNVSLEFKPNVVKRKSLNGDEVDNILVLLSQGWDYSSESRPPRGEWRGRKITGWTSRNPNIFMYQIIESYNKISNKIRFVAELDDKYYNEQSLPDTYDDIGKYPY